MTVPKLTDLARQRAHAKRLRSRQRAEAMLRHPSARLASHSPDLEIDESQLLSRLLAGEIDGARYRAEMRRLADRAN